jgi:hypothetical protein
MPNMRPRTFRGPAAEAAANVVDELGEHWEEVGVKDYVRKMIT